MEAQEKLGIRYEHVSSPMRLNEDEFKLLADMRLQLEKWGDAPLSPILVQRLGDWCDEEVILARNFKRKRTFAEDDLAMSNLAPSPNPNASTTSHRTYHAPSPPPLEDLLPSRSHVNTVSYTHPPALNITHPQPQAQRQETSTDTINHRTTQQFAESEDSVYLGDFTSSFDLAFAKWLDEKNISKAVIGRLFKDPAMQPTTSKLSWKSVAKMKDRLKSVEFHEDDDE